MTYDEEVIAIVRALSAVQSICTNKRIYHWEVLASDPNRLNFPCIVYNMSLNVPNNELDGTSGIRTAEFQFDCYSERSSQLRELQEAIDTINQTYTDGLEWIEVAETTDDFEPPIDLNEKGVKAAQLTVKVQYRPSVTTTTTPAP